MKKKKLVIDTLTSEDIEKITKNIGKKKKVPMIKTETLDITLDKEFAVKARKIARSQKIPYTTFISKLIQEDIERLWMIYSNK